jgi:hypothetical protein
MSGYGAQRACSTESSYRFSSALAGKLSSLSPKFFSGTLLDWLKDLPIHATFSAVHRHLRTPIMRWKLKLWRFYILWYTSITIHCATNRKVAGSMPDGVIGIFHWHNPTGRTMALGSTQPLKEMSTRNVSWGKGGRCVGLTLPPSCTECLKIWKPQPPGTLRVCQGL